MPLIQVNMLSGRTPEQKAALLRAITEAVHTSIGSPIASIRVWIHEFPAENFIAAGELATERAAPAAGPSPPGAAQAPTAPGSP